MAGVLGQDVGVSQRASAFPVQHVCHQRPQTHRPGSRHQSGREVKAAMLAVNARSGGGLANRLAIARLLSQAAARTIADLAGAENLTSDRVSEAIQFW